MQVPADAGDTDNSDRQAKRPASDGTRHTAQSKDCSVTDARVLPPGEAGCRADLSRHASRRYGALLRPAMNSKPSVNRTTQVSGHRPSATESIVRKCSRASDGS